MDMRFISLFRLGISSPEDAFLLGLLGGVTRTELSTPALWGDRIALFGTSAWEEYSGIGRTLQIHNAVRSCKIKAGQIK